MICFNFLRVGDEGPNVSKTHDEECNGLGEDVKAQFALSIVEIIACTYKEVCHYPQLR